MIRVLVAEDQGMILGALAALLDLEADIQVIDRAADGAQALRRLQREPADVLVTDIEMPGLSGLDLARHIQKAGWPTKVLIVTTFARPGYLRRAMDAGVRGYLLKDTPSEQLADAVRRIAQGQRVVAPDLMDAAWGEPDPLSERERQALRLAEDGRSAKAIAAELGLSPGTARNYLHEASQKLGVTNRIEAARLARARGWL
ncbi:MAG: DNA-binding response regulator [Rhodothalassiaceae bacterium]